MTKSVFWLLISLRGIKIIIHLFANANYGFHADELYYITLSKHLNWGYLDNSPFIAFITKLSNIIFGDSVFSYRIFPTLFSAATIYFTGLITISLGGKRLAVLFACLASICSPAILATSYLLQPVVFDQFFWTSFTYFLIKSIQKKKGFYINVCAIFLAIGILNKYTILIYAFGMIVTYLIVQRPKINFKVLPIPILLISTIIGPNIYWQVANGIPFLKYISIVNENNSFIGYPTYLFQFTFFHGAGMSIWISGLFYLLFSKNHRRFSFIVWAFLLTLGFILAIEGKIYYILGMFPVMFAAGGLCWEQILLNRELIWKYLMMALLIIPSIIALPIVIPILPFPKMLNYLNLMTIYTSIDEPLRWEDNKIYTLPQTFADMIGWEEITKKVDEVYNQMSKKEKINTIILVDKYYLAGAINKFKTTNLEVISSKNSLISWSPNQLKAEIVIYISNKPRQEIQNLAVSYQIKSIMDSKYARIKNFKVYLKKKPSDHLKQLYRKDRAIFLE